MGKEVLLWSSNCKLSWTLPHHVQRKTHKEGQQWWMSPNNSGELRGSFHWVKSIWEICRIHNFMRVLKSILLHHSRGMFLMIKAKQ
ncbi:hypothetical protein CFP56_037433 [Quercus suber]|uniref:Uncharacterized protein n=1 Tax=Quercus suber TaxID=58331 RepID=A0AAW0LNK9_QUESU